MFISPEQIMQEKDEIARRGIERGRDVVGLEFVNGIAFVAENTSATLNKISEIYDRIAFAGVGIYQEYDPLRMLGIEQAEVKGYTYSREDVTAKWLASLYSQVVGNVWRQYDSKPLEIELMVAEVGEPEVAPNRLYRISYDGRLSEDRHISVVGGKAEQLRAWLVERHDPRAPLASVVLLALNALRTVRAEEDEPLTSQHLEVAVLDETRGRRKFRRFTQDEIAALLADA
jgi:proteasome alpha subunit